MVSGYYSVYKPADTHCQRFYADRTLRDVTQKSLNSINQWCKRSGLKLSQLETHCVIFTNRRSWLFSKSLKLDASMIEMKNSRKFFGIRIDSKLSWNQHRKRVQEIQRHLDVMQESSWPFLGFQTSYQQNCQMLNGVQQLANVLITGAMPSTPDEALNVITGISPINLWLEEAAAYCLGDRETFKSRSLAIFATRQAFGAPDRSCFNQQEVYEGDL